METSGGWLLTTELESGNVLTAAYIRGLPHVVDTINTNRKTLILINALQKICEAVISTG